MFSFTDDDPRGRFIAQCLWSELEKISAAEMGDPQSGNLQQGAEASPAHGVVGVEVEQLDQKRAKGIPVVQPPPGYVYAPELASFKPNEADPGWMTPEQQAAAQENKGWYDQGQMDLSTQRAQQEADTKMTQQVQAANADQQAQQSAAQQQAAMDAEAKQQAVKESVKQQFKEQQASKAIPYNTPQEVLGRTAKAPVKKKKSAKAALKGVTINLGR